MCSYEIFHSLSMTMRRSIALQAKKEAHMANTGEGRDKRGLRSASKETRIRVAKMGGSAYHQKRGAKGSDSRPQNV